LTIVPALLPLGLAFVFNLALTPLVRVIGFKLGRVSQPRPDRWHTQPTPTLGGVGIFISFGLALWVSKSFFGVQVPNEWGFLSGSLLLFLTGLYDEFRPLTPIAKLVAQILAATLVIALGVTSTFFTPRFSDATATGAALAQLFNILLTYIWLVGISNAINLLDNMDGLAGGIALITAAVLAYFFWRNENLQLFWIAIALVGSLIGFLVFNFPPAKIFMGDSGSLFLGFTLAALAIAHQQQASNVFAVIGAPTLIFMLPILDTALVTITRLMRGRSPVQGGRDHTSHRLVAFGLSERQALLALYSVALFSAVMAAVLESLNYWLSLALAPLLILVLALMTAYLGRLKVVDTPAPSRRAQNIARWMADLTFRRRWPEAILDFFLIATCFYLAFFVAYNGQLSQQGSQLPLTGFLNGLPFAFASAYLSFYLFGVYRVVWRYVGFDDLIRYFQAALGSVALLAALVFVFTSLGFADWAINQPALIFFYFGAFLMIGLTLSRSSFRILDTLIQQRVRPEEQPVLIFGAGDAGEIALRWMLLNPQFKMHPVGFIDDDPLLTGRVIHGVRVLGNLAEIERLLEKHHIAGVILACDADSHPPAELDQTCQRKKIWVCQLRLEFQPILKNPDVPALE